MSRDARLCQHDQRLTVRLRRHVSGRSGAALLPTKYTNCTIGYDRSTDDPKPRVERDLSPSYQVRAEERDFSQGTEGQAAKSQARSKAIAEGRAQPIKKPIVLASALPHSARAGCQRRWSIKRELRDRRDLHRERPAPRICATSRAMKSAGLVSSAMSGDRKTLCRVRVLSR